jgi:two-component system response regulator AtoC
MPHDPCTSPSPAADRWRILVVDTDRRLASSLAEWLCGLGHHASAAGSASEAVRMIGRVAYDVCLVDAILPDDGAARVTVALRAHAPRAALASASRMAHMRGAACPAPKTQPRDLLGDHPTMRHALDVAARIAATPATVLITGESGTGKSLLARHIHAASGRAGRFVDVACGSLAESLLDSELFGHVPGAFTGATARRDGRFLLADGGTIFLDEITTASPAMQVKLLRVLQERQFEPLGGRDTITIDARVILATNDDLAALVASGRFRADLFWRIAVVTIAMPPLRERADDIPALAAHFLTAAAARAGRRVEGFTPRAIEALRAHRWPGNVRELEHAVERAVLLGRDAVVDLPDLPSTVASGSIPAAPATHRCGLKHDLAGPERRLILDALENAGWRRDTAARSLGINRTTLYKKLKRLGIDLADVAPSR